MASSCDSNRYCILFITFLYITRVICRDLYIDPSATKSNTTCTSKDPCKSLEMGVKESAPGDTLLLVSSKDGVTYPATYIAMDWSLNIVAQTTDQRPTIKCLVVGPNPCIFDAKNKGNESTTIAFENINIDGCRLCFKNTSVVLNSTTLVDSAMTVRSGENNEMLIYDSHIGMSSFVMSNYCNRSNIGKTNKTCPDTSLVFFMVNTTFTGKQSGLTLSNISEVQFIMDNVTLKHFKSEIYLSASKKLQLELANITLSNFKSLGAGITIDATHSDISASIFRSKFEHNQCMLGAALSIKSGVNVSIEATVFDSTFINNIGNSAGSAINLDLKEIRQDDDITDVVLPMKQHVVIENTVFRNNLNDESAAAVYIAGGNVSFINSDFQNNSVTAELSIPTKSAERKGAGGAIYGMATANILVDGCLIVNNSANWFGGGIAGGAAFTLTNSNFENSDAAVRSNLGEILYLSGPVKLANLTFNIIHAQNNVPLIWYASNDNYILQAEGDGFLNFHCPQGSQFRNDTLPQLDLVDAYKDMFYFCDPCPDNMYSLQYGYRSGALTDGDWSSNFTCLPCSYGAVCRHGLIHSQHNFWGYAADNNTQVDMLACPDGYCCPTDTCDTYNQCAANRSGTLCGECKEGMSETLFTTECIPSESCHDSWYFLIDIFSSIITLLFFLYQFEILALTCKYLFWVDVDESDDPTFAGYVKSVFYFYQTIDLLKVQPNRAEKIVGVAIQPVISYLLSFRSIAIIIGACPFPGINPVTKTVLKSTPTIYSFILLGILTLFYVIYKKKFKRNEPSTYLEFQRQASEEPDLKKPFGSRIALAAVSYFLYNYISISNMTFQLLACVPVGGKSVLYLDGNVECIQPWQGIFITIAIIHVCPFFMSVIASRYLLEKHLIDPNQLFVSYFLPLPMLLYWLVRYLTKWRNAIAGLKVEDAMTESTQLEPKPALSESELVKVQILDVIEEPFINNTNAEAHRYWEGILIFRRLVLSAIAAFAIEPLLGITLQSFTCFIFLLWHIHAQPFGTKQANNFETVSLSILTLVGICHIVQATLLSAGVPAMGPSKTQIFVTDWIEWILVNMFPMLLGLALVIFIIVRLFMCCGSACKKGCRKLRNSNSDYATLF